jgi:Fe(3+) dicitrate transport protein
MFDWNLSKTFFQENENFNWNAFSNIAITDSQYLNQTLQILKETVEFVPLFNIKTGTGIGYKTS